MIALLFLLSGQEARPIPDVASHGDRIEVRKDIAFGGEPHQKLDLYIPKGDGPFPLVVCWFGGGFTGGDKGGMSRPAAFLASRGIAAAAPGYFLARPKEEVRGWPKNLHDAKGAVRFLRAGAKEYRIDPERIAGMGTSSGAYLALLVGFTPNLPELEGEVGPKGVSSRLSAIVDIAGVCDRRASLGTGTEALLGKGYEHKPDLRALASPVLFLGRESPPVYILHGDQDKTVDISSAKQLDEALEKAGVPRKLHVVAGAGHNPLSLDALESIVSWLKERLLAAAASGSDWAQYMRTPERTGDAAAESLALPLGLVAQVRLDDAVTTSPAVIGPRAYVVDQMGTAVCIEWRSGRRVWTASPDGAGAMGSNTSSPCVAKGRVYYGTTAGTFHVLDAESGKTIRTIKLGWPVTGSPTLAGDSIYVQTVGAILHSFDLDGRERWRWDHYKDYARPLPDSVKGQHPGSYDRPHYGGGEVAVSGKQIVTHFGWDQVCLEDRGGQASLVWCNRAGLGKDDGIPLAASISGGSVFTAWPGVDAAGSLLRVSLADGSFAPKADQVSGKWAIFGTPAVRGSAVYFGRTIRGVEAYEFGKGGLWSLHGWSEADGHTPSITSPALSKEHAVFTTLTGELVVASLAAKGGQSSRVEPKPFRFRTPHGKPIGSSPAISQGHVFFGCDDGYFYVLGPGGALAPTRAALDVHLARSPVQSPTGKVYAWPSPYGGPGNTKFVDDPGLKPPFSLRWAVRGFGVFKQPVSATDRDLYFGDLAGFVACLEQETGRLRWRVKLPKQEWASGGVLWADGRLYVMRNGVHAGSPDRLNAVFCLDAATGDVLWHREIGAPGDHHWGRAAPLLVEGRLVSGAVKGNPPALWVEAWDARSGEPSWQVPMKATGRGVQMAAGCAEGGILYFSGGADKRREEGGETVAIEAASGRVVWRTSEHYCPGSGTPVVRDGRLYTSGWDWPVACLSTKDGSLLWKMEGKQYWFNGPALGPDFLTCRGYGGHAYRFSLEGKKQDIMIGSDGFT